jgi:hypothetical protein
MKHASVHDSRGGRNIGDARGHRFINVFRKYGLERRYGAVLVTYADDFVVLCRNGAAEVLDTTRRWMTSIGLALNETKAECGSTRLCSSM